MEKLHWRPNLRSSARPDELALDFDNFVRATVGNFREEFNARQLEAIARLNAELAAMSAAANSGLWAEEAVYGHPRWRKIRALANDALLVLGWQNAG